MFFLYSILLTLGFIILLPRFLFDVLFNGKYAAGFPQRLGFVPNLTPNGRKVIWLHCVSVGEVNAARVLAFSLRKELPDTRLIVSTTTRTGQELARNIFAEAADLVFYFPFDWKSTVRRALRRLQPSIVILMETEIWFNFLREASKSGARTAIVNGRLSERSLRRYSWLGHFMHRIMTYVDLALMQSNADATRIMALGLRGSRVKVTGNLKFDHESDARESDMTEAFRERFGLSDAAPLIFAVSTHDPEERLILDAFKSVLEAARDRPRLMIAPRHPERFDEVASAIARTGLTMARRSHPNAAVDTSADVILLDSIGEVRAAYPLAELVFVGGSLIPHGGQSIFEPAAAGKPIITGPHMTNFLAAMAEFKAHDAVINLPEVPDAKRPGQLAAQFSQLLADPERRQALARNALAVMENNRGAVSKTLSYLTPLIAKSQGK